ncbi:MAG TPA: cytochrome c oxidase assembly protein [Acidimicrobiales bacterium]|nr:cytochrome c oxidase assembly protein [Acidimicrobiales bacterium]
MTSLLHHWSLDPFIAFVALTVLAHELGLARMRANARPASHQRRRRRSWYFYAGLALLLVSVVSPLDYWSSSYFYVHMIDHVIAAFYVPMLIVAGAPWLPLLFALPVGARRKVGRFFYLSRRARFLRGLGHVIRSPLFAVISFNVVMVGWHVPRLFELSESNNFIHVWFMHGSFLVAGTLFWLQFIPSHPMKPARGAGWQIGAILLTNVVMTLLAMSMSILATASWYANYSHVPGVTLSPFVDQQIGGAILWVCGDFWALPALILIVRRLLEHARPVEIIDDGWTGRQQMSVDEFRGVAADDSR